MNKKETLKGKRLQITLSHIKPVDRTLMRRVKKTHVKEWMEIKKIGDDVVYETMRSSSLKTCLTKPMCSYDFYMILGQFVKTISILKKLGLNGMDILWDTDYIYMSPVTRELKFMYCPNQENSLDDFIEELIYSWKLSNPEDTYVSKFVYSFRNKGFSMKNIIEFISKQNPEVIDLLALTEPVSYVLEEVEEEVEQEEAPLTILHFDNSKEDEEIDFSSYVDEGIEFEDEEISLEDIFQKYVKEEIEEKNTQLISSPSIAPRMILKRIQTDEKIIVSTDVFTIGKSEYGNEYTIYGNRTISRNHCMIRRKGEQFSIEDLESSNGTFINQHLIEPHKEMWVQNGDTITLGNEDFIVEIYK